MKTKSLIALLLTSFAFPTFAQAQERGRLGLIGGLAGAGLGAAIGKDRGNTAAGGLIGGAVGLLAGSSMGDAIDQQNYRTQAYHNAVVAQQARAVTMAEVVNMTHAGLGDAVIISHIQSRGVAHQLAANDLIVLKQQGVSDAVLSAMQHPPQPVVIAQPAPVIVHEYYAPHPRPAFWYHHHHHHRHWHPRHPRGGVSWGISVSN